MTTWMSSTISHIRRTCIRPSSTPLR
uniref:Uncharacterized protein n=1 Tax=Anguilla anguilla TaxID=7936 RepID=A0A0E9P9C4_ANGAN